MATATELYPKQLHTERLTLELMDYSDEQFKGFLEWVNSPQSLALQGDFGIKTPHDMMRFTAPFRLRSPRFKDGIAERDLAYYLRLRSGGPLIGLVAANLHVAGHQQLPPDIGWMLAEPAFGKGYATEAGREILRLLREDLGFNDVCVLVSERNTASNRVAERLGFQGGNHVYSKDDEKWEPVWVLPHMGKLNITEPVHFQGEVEQWEKDHPGALDSFSTEVPS